MKIIPLPVDSTSHLTSIKRDNRRFGISDSIYTHKESRLCEKYEKGVKTLIMLYKTKNIANDNITPYTKLSLIFIPNSKNVLTSDTISALAAPLH